MPDAKKYGEQGEAILDLFCDALDNGTLFADAKNRTVDVVWYGGQTVPRYDAETDTDYMLRLNMAGCRMARLTAGETAVSRRNQIPLDIERVDG